MEDRYLPDVEINSSRTSTGFYCIFNRAHMDSV